MIIRTSALWRLGLAALAAALAVQNAGCIAIAVSETRLRSHEEKMTTLIRTAYITQRRADGKPDSQIAAEIREIDRDWAIDLALSRGDLDRSTKRQKLYTEDCDLILYSHARTHERVVACEARHRDQRRLLLEAGIELDE
jgi:hypothetical protein